MPRFPSLLVTTGLAACVLAAGPAAASDATEVDAVVRKLVADFDKGDMKAVAAACAPRAAIIDDIPPYAWQSCADWLDAYAANGKAIGLTDPVLSIEAPVYTEVSGADAYAVYPVIFTDRQKGEPAVYRGTWTLTLHRTPRGWTVTGASANWGGSYTVHNSS